VQPGIGSAIRSIQKVTGEAPGKLAIDLGIMDVIIRQPRKEPATSVFLDWAT